MKMKQEIVQNFDLLKFLGRWYQIGRSDNWFQRGLTNVYADYTFDGEKIRVKNVGKKYGKQKQVNRQN